jgi:hypothetical protein
MAGKETDWNVLKWLPGLHQLATTLIIPKNAEPGRYNVYFALLDPFDNTPAIKLAVEGKDAQNWYSWSILEIVKKGKLQEILTKTE